MEGINTLTEQSYQDRPQFSMGGRREDIVIATAGPWTNQDIIDKEENRHHHISSREILHMVIKEGRCQMSKGIPRMVTRGLCKEDGYRISSRAIPCTVISRVLCKEEEVPLEGTMDPHKTIHPKRIMVSQDREKEEILCQRMLPLPAVGILTSKETTINGLKNRGNGGSQIRGTLHLLVPGNKVVLGKTTGAMDQERMDIKARGFMRKGELTLVLSGKEQLLVLAMGKVLLLGIAKVKTSPVESNGIQKDSSRVTIHTWGEHQLTKKDIDVVLDVSLGGDLQGFFDKVVSHMSLASSHEEAKLEIFLISSWYSVCILKFQHL